MMKNLLGRVALAAAVFIGSWTAASAHEDAKGPHGGVVKEFGSFHMEGILEGASVKFYLLDGKGASGASTDTTGGSITVISGGGAPVSTKVEAGKFAEASAAADGKKVTASISLKVGGKNQSAKFSFK